MDKRFLKSKFDPRFQKISKNENKLKIDKRFSAIFDEKSEFDFGSGNALVDKRGKRVEKNTRNNDLKKFYKIESSDSQDSDGSESEEESEEDSSDGNESSTKYNQPNVHSDEEESVKSDSGKIDMARGEGNVESSDESDLDSDALEALEQEESAQGPWADEDIPRGDETRRFACVNLDWDHVKARDLYKVFDAFKPPYGSIKSVTIYPSEFGKEQMEKEAMQGPPSAVFEKQQKNDEGKDFNSVALRKYQVDRLRYYYAVIECDTRECAQAIFNSCDGAEFESSANFFDLRYIPDDMEFENEPRDVAQEAPISYQPVEFTTQALQHSKVKLTWDNDDPDRIKTTRKKFSKEDLKDMDFKAYLASDSDSAEDDQVLKEKYKALLLGDNNDSDDDEECEDMEITFAPGLSEKAAKKLEEKKELEKQKEETVFEAQLRKRREKRLAKKLLKKSEKMSSSSGDDSEERDDLDDPFFQTSFGSDFESDQETSVVAKKVSNKKKTSKKLSKQEREEQEKSKKELELLLMDDDGQSKAPIHFSAKDVIKAEKSNKSRKQKKKLQKQSLDTQDSFKMDLSDPRFASLLEDHQFFIDPTNPQFKSTNAMKEILQKKREHRSKEDESVGKKQKDESKTENTSKAMLNSLVDSVKRKSALVSQNGKGKRAKTQ